MKRALAVILLGPWMAWAGDLGQIGQTYPIREPDYEEMIREKLSAMQKEGKFEEINKQIEKKARAAVERPKPVKGLQRVTKSSSRIFDPSIVLTQTISDSQGNVIAPVGTRVNPLEHVGLTSPIFLFDGDDDKQVDLASSLLKKYGRMTLVLTSGNYMETTKRLQTKIYFDQASQLTKRFQIVAVPSLITQEGKRLKIDEIAN